MRRTSVAGMNPITLAQALPEKARAIIYSILPTLVAPELLFDWVDSDIESKILGVLVILGFGTALSNTPAAVAKWGPPPSPAPPASVDENYLGEFQ